MYVLEKGVELENKRYLTQGWGMVKGNVGRIRHMAMDLLNYAKDREPEYELCNPNRPVQEILSLMATRAEENGVTLKAELERDLPETWLDPDGVHRALLDLVTNAIDACTDVSCSSREREVVLRSAKRKGWAVEYQVSDNGCGMSRETKKKLFQTFFSTKGSGGTGLGLMIAKKIIDEHGGLIQMESKEGEGSTFFIRLPRRDQPPPSPDDPSERSLT
jgi:signal transduction histidine kinase